MKKFLALVLIFCMSLNFVACSSQPTNISQTTVAATIEETKVEETTVANEVKAEVAAEPIVSVNLEILKEQDNSMINTYTLLAVDEGAPFVNADGNEVNDVKLNTVGADAFINWMLGEGATLAGEYGVKEYGEHLFYLLDDYPKSENEIPVATDETKQIRISTTTSVNDSGLLSYLVPIFEGKYGYKVEIFSAGTGKAIANAKAGNADLILVHAKAQEEKFVEDGFARIVETFEQERLSYMYNFFVLCGPKEDPANVKGASDVLVAFKQIADGKYKFVSRGDNSGTHTKEISLWPKELGITTDAATFVNYKDWYISSNAGMGVCLMQASEQGAYILSDKATFLTFIANGGKIK